MNAATQAVMFSSKTDMHSTPQAFFDALDLEFDFMLDVCATKENAKCYSYFTEAQDALLCDWAVGGFGAAWMNPPYGRGIGAWVKKAYETSVAGRTVVCLLPARTDTRWWHDYVIPFGEVRFVKGRLKFGNAKTGAPFPSAVVIFRAAENQNQV